MTYFDLIAPEHGAIPVLVEVPHAGLEIPKAVLETVTVSKESVMRDADIFVDRLYDFAPTVGAHFLAAKLSRYVVDLNRAANDVDEGAVAGRTSPIVHQPRGVVWRMTTDGQRCLHRPLSAAEFQARIDLYYAPYHAALEATLRAIRERFGWAILLAAHSMPSVGRTQHSDRGIRRADIVPGTRGRTTAAAEIIDVVDGHFRAAGLSVRHDEPYRGGFSTTHYGRPSEGWHAVQIELNRALYVDEATYTYRTEDAARLSGLLRGLVEKLGAVRPPSG
ncbi:MAG: N-formylglutamate amidohydrolase [Polyangiales bacterium]|nr:N-formylglutamate amidohydrolase [Myxococcales bacterium]